MSFLKYQEIDTLSAGNGRGPLSFSRAHIDGMPFRGQPVALREEEFEEFTETVWDGKVKMFDMSNPEHQQEFQEVVDRIANNWYRGMKETEKWVTKPDGSTTLLIFMAWAEPHRELNKSRAGHLLSGTPVPTAGPTRLT